MNYLDEFKIQKNPKQFVLNRQEASTSIFSEIKLLIERNNNEIMKNNGRVLYSHPLKSLCFSDESDLKKFESDIDENCGIFQIKSVNIINVEKTKDGIKCSQQLGVSFIKNWRDFSFSKNWRNLSFRNENDIFPYKFKECENISVIIDAEKIMFSDSKNCIYDESNSFYFVSILKYEAIKSFVLAALADLKKTI